MSHILSFLPYANLTGRTLRKWSITLPVLLAAVLFLAAYFGSGYHSEGGNESRESLLSSRAMSFMLSSQVSQAASSLGAGGE